MASLLDPVMLPILLTGVLMLLLAATLLIVDFNNLLHRVFALFLVFQGLPFFLFTARFTSGPHLSPFYTELLPYLYLPMVTLTILFAHLYPVRRGWLGRSRAGPWVVLLATAGLMAWYLFDHSAYGTIAERPEGWLSTAGGKAYVEYGPLFLIASLRRMLPGALALFLAWDYWKYPHGSGGFSRFLVYAGFALTALNSGTGRMWDLVYVIRNVDGFPWWPLGWSQFVVPVLGLPLALASLWYIWKASKGEKDSPTLQEPRRFILYIAPLAILSAVLLSNPNYEQQLVDGLVFVFGLWALSIPLLVTYALLRFQVFGTDVAVKKSVAKVVLVALFTVIFFLILEAAESLLGEGLGLVINIVLAAILALLAVPLQGLASRAADRIMPDTKSFDKMSPRDRGHFYQEQHQLVLEDGRLSPKDRMMLDRLALTLYITERQQKALESGRNELSAEEPVQVEEPAVKRSQLNRLLAIGLTALVFGGVGQGLESLIPADSFGFSLVAAAFVTLIIGPIQTGVDRIMEPRDVRQERRRRLDSYWKAAQAAVSDGHLTIKEKRYLDRLQKELNLSTLERKRLDLRAARRVY